MIALQPDRPKYSLRHSFSRANRSHDAFRHRVVNPMGPSRRSKYFTHGEEILQSLWSVLLMILHTSLVMRLKRLQVVTCFRSPSAPHLRSSLVSMYDVDQRHMYIVRVKLIREKPCPLFCQTRHFQLVNPRHFETRARPRGQEVHLGSSFSLSRNRRRSK